MIKTENLPMCIRHYSDSGYKIRQVETGELYNDAVDVVPCQYTYEETDEPIDDEPLEADEVVQILLGGTTE